MTHYELLGIPTTATHAEIRKAYHKQALIWHPDKNPDDRDNKATEKFKLINKAHEVLSDPDKKLIYDREIEASRKKHPEPPQKASFRKATPLFNADDFIYKIKSKSLSKEEIKFIWESATEKNHTEVLDKLYDINELLALNAALKDNISNYKRFLSDLVSVSNKHYSVLYRQIRTMDEFFTIMESFSFSEFLKEQLIMEFRLDHRFAVLINNGLSKENEDKCIKLLSSFPDDFLSEVFYSRNSHLPMENIVLTTFYLKKRDKSNLLHNLTTILSWPIYSSVENKVYRDKLLAHVFDNYLYSDLSELLELFYSWFFTLDENIRTTFFAFLERIGKMDEKSLTYFAWHRLNLKEEELAAQGIVKDKELESLKTVPAVALFFFKRISKDTLCDKLDTILDYPAFKLAENKVYRDELLNYFFNESFQPSQINSFLLYRRDGILLPSSTFQRSDQTKLFYKLFFQLDETIRASFLTAIKEPKDPLFLIYTAWQQKDLREKTRLMKAIPFLEDDWYILSKLPPGIPSEEIQILAEAVIKSPDFLRGLHHEEYRIGLFVPSISVAELKLSEEYREIFNSIESKVLQQLALTDDFIIMLNKKVEYYRDAFSKQEDNSESRDLYKSLSEIAIKARNQYAISPRDAASKKYCTESISEQVKKIETTLKINDTTAAAVGRGFKSLLGGKPKDMHRKFKLSENMYAFRAHPNSQVVRDLVQACSLEMK